MTFNFPPSTNPFNLIGQNAVNLTPASRDPTSGDNTQGIGSEWQNTLTGDFFKLVTTSYMGVVGNAFWDQFASQVIQEVQQVTTNSGVAKPTLDGNLNLVGTSGSGITSSGSGATVTLSMLSPFEGDFAFTQSVTPSSVTRKILVSNSDTNTPGTNSQIIALVGGTNSGDPQSIYSVSGGATWSAGVDNSAADSYVVSSSATLGTNNRFAVSTAGAVTFNNVYTFPVADGSAHQLFNTDGSGNISFTSTPTVSSITINNAPVVDTDGTNKAYVDSIAGGFNFKTACYAATTVNLNATYLNGAAGVGATLTNAGALVAFSVDGVSPPVNSRILVKNQTSTFQNGIYDLTTIGSGAIAWILTRSTDYDQPSEIQPGDFVIVDNGTSNAHTAWLETATVTTIGTDPILFTQFGSTVSLPVPVTEGGTGLTTIPTNGQLLIGNGTGYTVANLTAGSGITITNGVGSISISVGGSGGLTQVVQQVFTSNGTYTPTTGMEYCIIEVVGGGAGGGGTAATSSSQGAAGGGGGAGGYSRRRLTGAQVGVSQAVTIGSGGAGGVANNPGVAGNASSLGALVSATGGSPGASSGSGGAGTGGVGGVGVGGDLNSTGGAGVPGQAYVTGGGTSYAATGPGGNSYFGGGARSGTLSGGLSNNGEPGNAYGGGGAGGCSLGGGGSSNGGAGFAGVIVITEYV